MKTGTHGVLPPLNTADIVAAPKRRHARRYAACKKWHPLNGVVHVTVALYASLVLAWVAAIANNLPVAGSISRMVSTYVVGESWLLGAVFTVALAIVLCVAGKGLVLAVSYRRGTTKFERRHGLAPSAHREPVLPL